MDFVVVIPARYASSRLPGKPLREIGGRAMVEHVYRRALESGAAEVVVATDDERIARAAEAFGARACMTDPAHPSGTDRLAEVARRMDYAEDRILVNLQCDEPAMPPTLIRQVAEDLEGDAQASIATLCERIETAGELFDPHVVKVIMDRDGYAIYFSRAVIPWDRDAFAVTTEALPEGVVHHRHIGLYAYRAGFIQEYIRWGPCALERMEGLEQLRALWHGRRIRVAAARERPGHGVDTERDLERAARALGGSGA